MRQWMNIINEAIEANKDKSKDWYNLTGEDATSENIKKTVQQHWGKVPTISGNKITIDGQEIGTYTNGSATLRYRMTDTGTQLTEPPAKTLTTEAMVDSLPEQETKTTYTLHINGEAKLSMEDYDALIDLIHDLNQENHDLKIDIKEKVVPRDSTYESTLTETIRKGVEVVFLDENLHKWFKEKWVRFGPDGKIRGDCARGSSKEGKPKCLPQAKAHAIGKKARKSAANKKRREDPNPERKGKAKNVATKPERKVDEASSPAQQAAIAINMKKAGKKPRVNESEDDGLNKFHRELLNRMKEKSAEIQAQTAIAKAQDPDAWLWKVGDLVYSEKTGNTYEIMYTRVRDVRDHETKTKTPTAVYGYQRGEEDDENFERGEFIAHLAHDKLKKLTPDDKEQLDELKCWSGYTRVKGVPAGAPGSCKKKSVKEGAAESTTPTGLATGPRAGLATGIGPHQSDEIDMMLKGEKKVALMGRHELNNQINKHKNLPELIQQGSIKNVAQTPDGKLVFLSVPGYEDRAKMLFQIWTKFNEKAKDPQFRDSGEALKYHTIIGRLLGYSEQDIEHFLSQFSTKIKQTRKSAYDTARQGIASLTEYVAEGGAETSWSHENEKITLQDILELTKHIKQINLPINDNLKNKLIHWDGNPEEIERINQVTVSNQFPILVMVDEQGQINWILDGNHRLHKAIRSQAKTIPAKLIKPSDLSDKAKRIFHIKEQGVAESIRVDVPSEEWLQGKIDYAKKKGRDRFGVPGFNSTTAYYSNDVRVPIEILRRLPGMRDEQQRVRQQDLEAIKKILKDTGRLPINQYGQEYAPFVMVAYNGEAWVNEGNHRIMAAAELYDQGDKRFESLPIELKYFDGGERVKSGPLHPSKISKQGVAESIGHNVDDLSDVADWMRTTPDKLKMVVKQEPIEKFIKQIREMYGTYDEFPEDEERTNRILKLLKKGSKPLPIYVEDGDPDLFVMEGRHRMVAFWLAGMKTIPVAYVSVKKQGVAEAGPFRSTEPKKPRKGSVADLAAKKRKEQERNKPPIEPKDQMVGVAKVTKGVAEENLKEFAPGPDFRDDDDRQDMPLLEFSKIIKLFLGSEYTMIDRKTPEQVSVKFYPKDKTSGHNGAILYSLIGKQNEYPTVNFMLIDYEQGPEVGRGRKAGTAIPKTRTNALKIADIIYNTVGLPAQDRKISENFADGRNPGRKGLAKRVGVNCKQSVTKLRSIAAKSSGERQRMAHWCANMKSGKKK